MESGTGFGENGMRDVDEPRRAEDGHEPSVWCGQAACAELARLAAERTAILNVIADGVVIADPSGRITFFNKTAGHLHGTDDLPAAEHLTMDGRPYGRRDLPLMRAALRGETVADEEFRIRRPDGTEVAVESSATPLLAEDGTRLGAVLTLCDVTARWALERQKDEFLASVSHDLRTPVTAIKASIGVVLANEPPGLPEPLHRMLVNIDIAADRMAWLVADLLELTRIQVGRLELRLGRCDLRALALRSARAIEPLAQASGQRVIVDVPPDPFPAVVDAERVERAVLNLLGNAQKYGRPGGTIWLSLERRADEAILAVADDGPGIPEDERARIFERFYRAETDASRPSQGSGLGLPIARAMIELHGGRIWVDSAPGAGSTFRVALPTNSRPPAACSKEGTT